MTILPSRLRAILRADFDAGHLFWLERTPEMFLGRKMAADVLARRWNTANAGKRALTYVDHNGYCVGNIWGRPHKAHRVLWALSSGEWPEEVDHINGDRTDNRLANLRAVSRRENSRNVGRRADNSTGFVGVTMVPETGRFRARVCSDGKSIHIGMFSSAEAAAAAQAGLRASLGFHENHGRA